MRDIAPSLSLSFYVCTCAKCQNHLLCTLSQAVPGHIPKAVEKASEALSLRSAYEDSIGPGKEADASLLATYLAYVKLEHVSGDPGRVQVRGACSLFCFCSCLFGIMCFAGTHDFGQG